MAVTQTQGRAPIASQVGQPTKCSAAVLLLAGGLSSRMGQHKCLLPFTHSQSFIEHIAAVYGGLAPACMLLVANQDMLPFQGQLPLMCRHGLQVLANHDPKLGRLHSVQVGLAAIPAHLSVLIHNTDNPFVRLSTIAKLLASNPERGYVSPRYQGQGGHPILLSPAAVQAVKRANKAVTLRDVLRRLHRLDLEVDDEGVLCNINTPDDYVAHFGHLHQVSTNKLCHA